VSAVKAHVTYQAIADELGLSRQRVQQIVARSDD
jgi:predicted transcriptional regulator